MVGHFMQTPFLSESHCALALAERTRENQIQFTNFP